MFHVKQYLKKQQIITSFVKSERSCSVKIEL